MSKSKRKDDTTYQPPTPPRWLGRDSLDLVVQLNERALTLVRQAVAGNTAMWPVAAEHRSRWSALDTAALQRAARFPFVILDAHFTDEAWWRVIAGTPEQLAEEPAAVPVWPVPVAQELLSELLVFAWHSVKWNRSVARLSLGMKEGVAARIAALTPRELALIAARQATALELRWQQDPAFWSRLLIAAREADEETLSDIHLHAKLLLSGALISRSPAS